MLHCSQLAKFLRWQFQFAVVELIQVYIIKITLRGERDGRSQLVVVVKSIIYFNE